MTTTVDRFTLAMSEGMDCRLVEAQEGPVSLFRFRFTWTKENAKNNDSFTLSWWEPIRGAHYKWDACCKSHRSVRMPWDDKFPSMISKNCPITCFFDGQNQNRYTWALSECQKQLTIKNEVHDGNGHLHPCFTMAVGQFTGSYETEMLLRIDQRPLTMRQAVADVARWWAEDLALTPLAVPPSAKSPVYSFWYSFHQAIDEKTVEEECRRAKDIGFDVCIIDDGWQTEVSDGSYAYCGDWEPAPSKFPDMAGHVARVHDLGMKYIIWYSVPYMGIYAKNFPRFQDKMLRMEIVNGKGVGVLDPRYPEVREYLCGLYADALRNWKLDGFKLDFIDQWCDDPRNGEYDPRMDIPALQDAVQVFMESVVQTLTQIQPEILLEFRQDYIGPHMKRFGNMFRVGDCGGDYIQNRVVTLDLRMMMGNQAVHSDMLAMPLSDTPENNALQIVSSMFGVVQYSGRLEQQSEETKQMAAFWTGFLKEHAATLLDGQLEAYDAQLLYPWAKATGRDECIVGIYGKNVCVIPDEKKTVYLANGTADTRILAELAGCYNVTILDCFGNTAEQCRKTFDGISVLQVPVGGIARLEES